MATFPVKGTTGWDDDLKAYIEELPAEVGPFQEAVKQVVVDRSTLTSFYDTFAGKPDGLIVAGEKSDSGHPYALRTGGTGGGADVGQGFRRRRGYLTHDQTNTADNQAAYGGIGLGRRVSGGSVRFIVPAEWMLDITGAPTGGTFTVTVDGNASAAIAYNANAATIQAALNAITGVTTAVVTGTTQKTIRLDPDGLREATVSASGAGLTGGSTPAAAISILPPETLTLIVSKYPFTSPTSDGGATPGGTGFSVAGAHCNFTSGQILYETLDFPFDGRDIHRAQTLPTWVRGKPYVAGVEVLGSKATMTLRGDWDTAPEPIQIQTKADPKIYSQSGNYMCFELYSGAGAKTELQITHLWAETVSRRSIASPSASRSEVAAAANKRGRLLYSYDTTGPSTGINLLTSSTLLLTTPQDFEVPADCDEVIIRASLWINRILPTAQVASSLRLRGEIANGSYGKEKTVISGFTLANTTGAAITHGELVHFSTGRVNIAALSKGDRLSVLIKAFAGAAGQFTFVDSGDALGGTASLRTSTVEVWAPPA